MTDNTHMEPTDDELDELRQANSGRLNFVTFREFRVIARAVLAKWGARQPVECAALVAAAEREACAQVCDHYATALDYGSSPYTHSRECKQAAAAIRARSTE